MGFVIQDLQLGADFMQSPSIDLHEVDEIAHVVHDFLDIGIGQVPGQVLSAFDHRIQLAAQLRVADAGLSV